MAPRVSSKFRHVLDQTPTSSCKRHPTALLVFLWCSQGGSKLGSALLDSHRRPRRRGEVQDLLKVIMSCHNFLFRKHDFTMLPELLQNRPLSHVITFVVLLLTFAAFITYELVRWSARVRGFSGPRGLPVVGNLRQIQGKDAPEQYRLWSKRYGPVYQIQLGNVRLNLETANLMQMLTSLDTRLGRQYRRCREIDIHSELTGYGVSS